MTQQPLADDLNRKQKTSKNSKSCTLYIGEGKVPPARNSAVTEAVEKLQDIQQNSNTLTDHSASTHQGQGILAYNQRHKSTLLRCSDL